jgi:predicted nucleic acid-binding protein
LIVCDTGPLVALSNERDEHYFGANDLFRDLFMAGEQIVLPATVLAEVCYWLNAHGGPEVEAAFLDSGPSEEKTEQSAVVNCVQRFRVDRDSSARVAAGCPAQMTGAALCIERCTR